MLLVSQLTKTEKIIEFWLDRFIIKDLRIGREIVSSGVLEPKYGLYNFYYSPMNVSKMIGMTTLITQTDDINGI